VPAGPLALHALSGAVSLRAAERAEVVRSGDLIVLESAVARAGARFGKTSARGRACVVAQPAPCDSATRRIQ
jgi:hypothetical protein